MAALPDPTDTLKGTVSMNWPPHGLAAVLEYQVENADESCTVTVLCERVLPLAGANVNCPLTTSRVVE